MGLDERPLRELKRQVNIRQALCFLIRHKTFQQF